MNKVEHLLACLAEECAEVSQAVGKALRFGLSDKGPEHKLTNAEYIAKEFSDVVAVVEMLEEMGLIPYHVIHDIEVKKNRILTFMKYAELRGTLKENK